MEKRKKKLALHADRARANVDNTKQNMAQDQEKHTDTRLDFAALT
jgi:hypothetical protein